MSPDPAAARVAHELVARVIANATRGASSASLEPHATSAVATEVRALVARVIHNATTLKAAGAGGGGGQVQTGPGSATEVGGAHATVSRIVRSAIEDALRQAGLRQPAAPAAVADNCEAAERIAASAVSNAIERAACAQPAQAASAPSAGRATSRPGLRRPANKPTAQTPPAAAATTGAAVAAARRIAAHAVSSAVQRAAVRSQAAVAASGACAARPPALSVQSPPAAGALHTPARASAARACAASPISPSPISPSAASPSSSGPTARRPSDASHKPRITPPPEGGDAWAQKQREARQKEMAALRGSSRTLKSPFLAADAAGAGGAEGAAAAVSGGIGRAIGKLTGGFRKVFDGGGGAASAASAAPAEAAPAGAQLPSPRPAPREPVPAPAPKFAPPPAPRDAGSVSSSSRFDVDAEYARIASGECEAPVFRANGHADIAALRSEERARLLGAFEHNTTVHTLELASTRLDNAAAEVLVGMLERGQHTLTSLNVERNQIGSDGMLAFARLLRGAPSSCALRELKLAYQFVTISSAAELAIAEGLGANTQVTKLTFDARQVHVRGQVDKCLMRNAQLKREAARRAAAEERERAAAADVCEEAAAVSAGAEPAEAAPGLMSAGSLTDVAGT